MPDIKESAKTKNIASNTLFLFVRMLVITFLNLYIVRVIIKGLGVEDYGIFNTIAGVVTVASFLTGVLSLSVQRFFSFRVLTSLQYFLFLLSYYLRRLDCGSLILN